LFLLNNIIFGDGKAGIAHSSQFLNNYLSSLSNIKEGILPVDVKGKRPIFELQEIQSDSPSPAKGSQWKPPDTNWLCLSVDASYIKETNVASWGALIRDHNGQVHCSAWGMLSKCATAEMAEAMACLEGIKFSVPLVASGIIIESDCANLIKKVSAAKMDRLRWIVPIQQAWYLIYNASSLIFQVFAFERFQERTTDRLMS
jgi:ribonuclease HI